MALTPAFGQDLGNVIWVEVHMHAPVRVVDVANLAVAADVDGMAGKEGEAVLLETAGCGAEFGRVLGGQTGEGGFEGGKGACGAVLVELALGREAGHGGRGARAVGEVLGREDAGCRTGRGAGGYGRRGEGVSEDEEAEPGEAGVAGECRGCATRSEEEKVVVVVADEEQEGHGEDDRLENGAGDEVHAHEEEEGATEEGVGVEGHGKGILTDDHVEGWAWGVAHEEVWFGLAFKRVAVSRGRERWGHFRLLPQAGFLGGDGLRLCGREGSHGQKMLFSVGLSPSQLDKSCVCVYNVMFFLFKEAGHFSF